MERIHNLLRKIQEIYYKKEEKQVIDIDLMLDYTRVLYADLLAARTDILAKQGMGFHLKDNHVFEEKANNIVDSDLEESAPHKMLIEEETTTLPASEELVNEEEEVAEIKENIEEAVLPKIATEEDLLERIVEHEVVSQEDLNTEMLKEVEVESAGEVVEEFEASEVEGSTNSTPGTIAEKTKIIINDEDFSDENSVHIALEEETPVYSEIHFELPEVKDKASESPKASFVFQKKKDIRSFIGINDKYQFMNELFANNRTAYEESLDKLSQLENYAAALEWLTTEALPQHNWQKEDDTFQSLLTVTKKYFEA